MDWKEAIPVLANDMLGLRARAVETGNEEALYPKEKELFFSDQFLTRDTFQGLFFRMKPFVPYIIHDCLTLCWAGLSLGDVKILAGPFAQAVITFGEAETILRFLKLDISKLEELHRYVFYSRLMGVEQVMNLMKACCHLFAGRELESPETLELLPENPLRMKEETTNKYVEHYQDLEAAYSAAIAHGNTRSAEEILRELQAPYLHLSNEELGAAFRDISGFTTQLTYARIAGRRAGVPAGALDITFRKYQNKAIQIHDHQKLLSLSFEATRAFCELVNQNSRRNYSSSVRNSIDYMERNFQQPIGLKNVAAHLGVNASALSSAFKKETGRTLTEHLNRIRLEHARILMAMSDFSIRDVCAGSGIADQSYFTKLFRETYGVTPMEYRRELIGQDRRAPQTEASP